MQDILPMGRTTNIGLAAALAAVLADAGCGDGPDSKKVDIHGLPSDVSGKTFVQEQASHGLWEYTKGDKDGEFTPVAAGGPFVLRQYNDPSTQFLYDRSDSRNTNPMAVFKNGVLIEAADVEDQDSIDGALSRMSSEGHDVSQFRDAARVYFSHQ